MKLFFSENVKGLLLYTETVNNNNNNIIMVVERSVSQ